MTDVDVEQLRAELERVRNRPCAQCDTREQAVNADDAMSALAAEVHGLRDVEAAACAENSRLRLAIETALRLYAGGHPHGDVLRAALRGEP